MSTSTPSGPAPGQATPPEPSARERFEWIRKNTRILLAALVLLLIALGVVVFSSALFTSSSANPGNLAASGIMEQANDQEGAAILTAEQLLPGDSAEGQVTISNVGDAEGDFSLAASNLVDDPADPAFSQVLTLVVSDGTATVYDGPLADAGDQPIDLGTWAAGEEHTYTFTVTFAEASGNEYQAAQTTLDFTWDATQS